MLFQEVLVKKVRKKDRYGKKGGNEQKNKHHDNRQKERNCSLKYRSVLTFPFVGKTLPGKVSLCTFWIRMHKKAKKASLTIETALVLPLFVLGMVTLLSFMDIYKLQTEHLSSLCQKAKSAGMYAFQADGKGTEEITLPDVYAYQPVGGLVFLPKVWMYNSVKVHAWVGTDHKTGGDENQKAETMVYVTESGQVYHKKLSCSYLKLSVTKVSGSSISSRRNAYGEKYHACETCSLHQKPAASVCITDKGNRYHNQESCSGLKRSVRLIKESELSGMHVCSRCG